MMPMRLRAAHAAELLRSALLVALLVFAAAMLAGCATEPQMRTVRVPVPVECRVATPARPEMPTDGLNPADPIDRKVKAALAELEIREGYEIELEAALAQCTKPLEDSAAH